MFKEKANDHMESPVSGSIFPLENTKEQALLVGH